MLAAPAYRDRPIARMHRHSGRWQLGLLLALTTAVLWGLLPIALKLTLQHLDAYTITWWRFAVSAVVLGALLAARQRLPPRAALRGGTLLLLSAGLAGMALNHVLYLLAIDQVTPTIAQTLIQLSSLFLLLLGVLVLRERFSALQWLGFLVLVVGLLLFFNRRLPELLRPLSGLGLGVTLLVLASIAWAGYGLAQKLLLRQLASQQILWLLYVGAVVALLPLSAPATALAIPPLEAWMLAFCCANTLLGYGAFAEALEHWEVSRVSAVLSLAPLVTLAAMWALGQFAPGVIAPEGLNALTVIGALLVVGGSMLSALGSQSAPATAGQTDR